eukprot:8164145-Alexandrium_andersonii.AAC.1
MSMLSPQLHSTTMQSQLPRLVYSSAHTSKHHCGYSSVCAGALEMRGYAKRAQLIHRSVLLVMFRPPFVRAGECISKNCVVRPRGFDWSPIRSIRESLAQSVR